MTRISLRMVGLHLWVVLLSSVAFFYFRTVQSERVLEAPGLNSRLKARKEVREMTCLEWERFSSAVNEFRQSGKWDDFANLHTDPKVWEVAHSDNSGLQAAFLPWHRVYLRRMERELQKIDSEVTLPYWNWALDSENPLNSPVLSEVFFGTTGSPESSYCVTDGSFKDHSNETCIQRALPSDPGGFLTLVNLKQVLTESPDYGRFVNKMENGFGLHGHLHMFLGGNMADLNSPKDPLFYAHHSFVDMLWWRWQRMHNSMGSPAYKGDALAPLYPFSESAADVFSAEEMGYTYSNPLSRNTSDESTRPCFLERGGERDIVALGEKVWESLPTSVSVLRQIPITGPSPKQEYFVQWMELKETQNPSEVFRSVDIQEQIGTWTQRAAAPRLTSTVWSFDDNFNLGIPVNALLSEEDREEMNQRDRREQRGTDDLGEKKASNEEQGEGECKYQSECGNCLSTLDELTTATCVDRYPEEFGPNLETAFIRQLQEEIALSEESGMVALTEPINPMDMNLEFGESEETLETGLELGLEGTEEEGIPATIEVPDIPDISELPNFASLTLRDQDFFQSESEAESESDSVAAIVDRLMARTMEVLEDDTMDPEQRADAVFNDEVLGRLDWMASGFTEECDYTTDPESWSPDCPNPENAEEELEEEDEEDGDKEEEEVGEEAGAADAPPATLDVDGPSAGPIVPGLSDNENAISVGMSESMNPDLSSMFEFEARRDETSAAIGSLFPDLSETLSDARDDFDERLEDLEEKLEEAQDGPLSLDYLFPINSLGEVTISSTWSDFDGFDYDAEEEEEEEEEEESRFDKYLQRYEESRAESSLGTSSSQLQQTGFGSRTTTTPSGSGVSSMALNLFSSALSESPMASFFSSFVDISPGTTTSSFSSFRDNEDDSGGGREDADGSSSSPSSSLSSSLGSSSSRLEEAISSSRLSNLRDSLNIG
jgi:tyrosinase